MNTVSFVRRFWVYQAERFPLISYAVLVAALVLGGFGYTELMAGSPAGAGRDYHIASLLIAWITTLGIFFQLRVADEFKDFVQDARYRPYRAVPRGLISRRELAILALAFAAVQFALNMWLDVRLLVTLALVWGYLWLMRREFFVHDWLVAHPTIYMLSHMVIMALLFVYILIARALGAGVPGEGVLGEGALPAGAGWFLLAGYANGIVFEIGRKLRAPADEELGVETYSRLWGAPRGAAVWASALAVAGGGLSAALWPGDMGRWFGGFVLLLLLTGFGVAWRYARQPTRARAKWIDRYSALWVLLLYTGVAVLPFLQ